ncbi:hypothetical protein H5P28_13875 [Ruficoccus amylovorans]|uniref:Uncharacterized protein n=1 Tax=Ruficoccus amylovorans TaxID=1804625 RepID=A0A842HG13_9BACT|nr:hypothetical protein [Ruficoccus amylovorans]MBC2595352.1 hypothetical protein [Ruficoccus amylovorans]
MLTTVTCLWAQATQPDTSAAEPPEFSLLGDPGFARGLILRRADGKPSPGNIYPFGKSEEKPIWGLAEWASKYELSEADKTVTGEKAVYTNTGKTIAFERMPGGGMHIWMDLAASTEYDEPRTSLQAWPHLLIEQSFPEKPYVKDLKALNLKFTGRLDHAEMKMRRSAFDPGLHSAQFQLFITVQNLNQDSENYGDFLWFGVPFYDYRERKIPPFAAQDGGKADASQKFIYSLGTRDYMRGDFHGDRWVSVETDLYPHILKAFELAQGRGFLTGSDFSDMRLASMNLGWEVTGTFDVGFEFKDFELLAIKRTSGQ